LEKLAHFKDRIKVVERVHTSQFGIFTVDRDYDYLTHWVEESTRLKCEYFQDFYRRLRYSLPPSELARLFEGIFKFEHPKWSESSESGSSDASNSSDVSGSSDASDSSDVSGSSDGSDSTNPSNSFDNSEFSDSSDSSSSSDFVQNGFVDNKYSGAKLPVPVAVNRNGEVVVKGYIPRDK
jgi:hypothetical protein